MLDVADHEEFDEDRRFLLALYSAKTTGEATYLVSEALIAVSIGALIQLFPSSLRTWILIFILSVLAAFSARTAYRVIYWGRLSYWVLNTMPKQPRPKD